jgi:hypothetical protein
MNDAEIWVTWENQDDNTFTVSQRSSNTESLPQVNPKQMITLVSANVSGDWASVIISRDQDASAGTRAISLETSTVMWSVGGSSDHPKKPFDSEFHMHVQKGMLLFDFSEKTVTLSLTSGKVINTHQAAC